jgi:putative transposase
MQRFRRMRSLQMFVSVHASVTNHFNIDRDLTTERFSRRTAPPLSPNGVSLAQHEGKASCPCRDAFSSV